MKKVKVYANDTERVLAKLEGMPHELYEPIDRDAISQLRGLEFQALLRKCRVSPRAYLEKPDFVQAILKVVHEPSRLCARLALRGVDTAQVADTDLVALAAAHVADECMVCCETLQVNCKIVLLPCGHSFHRACVETWLKTNVEASANELKYPSCPVCRNPIDLEVPRVRRAVSTAIQLGKRKRVAEEC